MHLEGFSKYIMDRWSDAERCVGQWLPYENGNGSLGILIRAVRFNW
jgi:hypothetical protein